MGNLSWVTLFPILARISAVAYLTGVVLTLVAVIAFFGLIVIASGITAHPWRVQPLMQHWITQHQVLAFDLMWTLRGALLVVWIAFFIDWGRAIRANFFE